MPFSKISQSLEEQCDHSDLRGLARVSRRDAGRKQNPAGQPHRTDGRALGHPTWAFLEAALILTPPSVEFSNSTQKQRCRSEPSAAPTSQSVLEVPRLTFRQGSINFCPPRCAHFTVSWRPSLEKSSLFKERSGCLTSRFSWEAENTDACRHEFRILHTKISLCFNPIFSQGLSEAPC